VVGLLTEELRILATGNEGRGPLGGRGSTVVAVVAMVTGGTAAAVSRGFGRSQYVLRPVVCAAAGVKQS
jgi:hypothetical protein